jgi:hypothetical protein
MNGDFLSLPRALWLQSEKSESAEIWGDSPWADQSLMSANPSCVITGPLTLQYLLLKLKTCFLQLPVPNYLQKRMSQSMGTLNNF